MAKNRKQKKPKKHPKFWLGFKIFILLILVTILVGGIVSIVTRNGSKGGNIALIVLFGLGALCGFTMGGSYSDLSVWAGWCLICTILAIVSLVKKPKNN